MANVTFLEPGTDATQDFSFFVNTTGTVASDTGQAYTGLRSIKCSTGAGAADANVRAPIGTCADAGTRLSCRIRFDVLPSANPMACIYLLDATLSFEPIYVAVRSDGTLALNLNGVGDALGSTVLQANTWYRLSVSWVITNTTTFTVKLFVNGTIEASHTNDGTMSHVGTSSPGFGIGAGVNMGANKNLWIDDIYIDDGATLDDPGDIRITGKRPFANGTATGMSLGGSAGPYGSGHAAYVNNQPLDTTAFVFRNGTGPVTEEYNIEGLSIGDVNLAGATILGVRGWVYADSTPDSTGNIVVDGTQTNIALTATKTIFAQNSATPTVFPAGTGADIGIVTTASDVITHLYECGVLIAYIAGRRFFLIPG